MHSFPDTLRFHLIINIKNLHTPSEIREMEAASESCPSLLFIVANACLKMFLFLQDFSRLRQLIKQRNLIRTSNFIKNELF